MCRMANMTVIYDLKKLAVEGIGTAVLVFIGAGAATLSFGYRLAGASPSAGVIVTATAFGLVLFALASVFGPISGCHVNPAVTLGFVVSRRMPIGEAIGYWLAQLLGGVVGALVLWGLVNSTSTYRSQMGLGANGFGNQSLVGTTAGGAILVEVVLTFVFVFVVLGATRKNAPTLLASLTIGFGLFLVHLLGIPFTGMSVNPARSLGPALFVGGAALSQIWVFLLAPLAGGALAALAHTVIYRGVVTEPVTAPDTTIDVTESATTGSATGSDAPVRT